ncbi:MAG: hypothetical protein L0I76_02485 [Pseudonocardia sp.]|nr:hypothetical protein [Pseudonocardia sp.]
MGIGALSAYVYLEFISVVRFTPEHGQVSVAVDTVPGLGPVLVTNKGYALYMFPPDGRRRVTCTGDCATAWPPLTVPAGTAVSAGPEARAELLGTAPNPDGGRVATYDGWPLYTYLGDSDPLRATGHGVDADGGYWYVMRPSGEVVDTSPH